MGGVVGAEAEVIISRALNATWKGLCFMLSLRRVAWSDFESVGGWAWHPGERTRIGGGS